MVKDCATYARNNSKSYNGNFYGNAKPLYLNSDLSSIPLNSVHKFAKKYGSVDPGYTSLNITNTNPNKYIYNYNQF